MGIFEATTMAIIKRPFIIIMIGLLMLVAGAVNTFLPVIAMITGIINMTGGGFFEAILSLLQMLIDPGIIPTELLLLAACTLLGSVAAGLLLPGYLLVVNDGLEQGKKTHGLFSSGLKGNFFRIFLITAKTILFTAFLAIFLMVASVPAIVATKAAMTTRPNLLIAAIFIDIVTVGVLFLSLSFFKAYVYMWFISAANGAEKPFKTGKTVADRKFWELSLRLLFFDVVFVAAIFTIYLSDSQIFRYAAGWVFTTGFFTTLAVYLVRYYRENSSHASSRKQSED